METDVLVVGDGPAGSTLARQLALAGREVTLIDRAAFPRHKPCGGGLSRYTIDALDLDFSPVMETEVSNLVVDGAWTGRFSMPVAKSCQVVSRWDFDAFLVKHAASAGARVLEKHGLRDIVRDRGGFQVSTDGGNLHARVVCACDGAMSRTSKALGFPRNQNLSVALEALAVLNIGVCTAQHGPGSGLRAQLARFVRNSRELHDLEIGHIRGGQLPTFRSSRQTYAERDTYLVGDAAGFVDLFTGVVLIDNMAAGTATEYLELPAGEYTIQGRDQDGNVLDTWTIPIVEGQVVTGIAAGIIDDDNSSPEGIIATDFPNDCSLNHQRVDYAGMWFDPILSGQGVQLVQDGDVMQGAWYTYDNTSQSTGEPLPGDCPGGLQLPTTAITARSGVRTGQSGLLS